jgi:FMN phosphatase YigB (HAD superfamily)
MTLTPEQDIVFLFDVDNTLIDNDAAKADIQKALLELLGPEGTRRLWELYEEVRKELDVVDYPETLRRFADSWEDKEVARKAAELINSWPYRKYLYPGSLQVLEYLGKIGNTAILSDGDEDYQPRKIANAGLTKAVGGPADVLIYTHKDECFEDVMRRLPGRHYVLVEDKERLLAAAKEFMGDDVTTVWVKQGHYAHDPKHYRKPDPDIVLEKIGDLQRMKKEDFAPPRKKGAKSVARDN